MRFDPGSGHGLDGHACDHHEKQNAGLDRLTPKRKLEIRKAKVEDGNGTLNAQGFQGRAEESRQSQMLNMAAMISATMLNDIGIW